ncbi:MAG: dihydropteroate synthase [Saprospiraceae bacterium]|jgi:dihydropteroate synthase
MLNQQTTINCAGKLFDLSEPKIMGILNVTPDSFYDGGHLENKKAILFQADKMLREGATILDIGGMSSRPGAEVTDIEEELRRVIPAVQTVAKNFPNAFISIDTVQGEVARQAVEHGAHIINDISAGQIDDGMYKTVADLQVPYILMHMQGQPKTMQLNPNYDDIVHDILDFFVGEIEDLRDIGVKDIIIDPGFGFGKTIEHNYEMLRKMHVFQMIGVPILAGLSRKSMIYKALESTPKEALNGTTALHIVALQQGAKILRVHDVKEAMECLTLFNHLRHDSGD